MHCNEGVTAAFPFGTTDERQIVHKHIDRALSAVPIRNFQRGVFCREWKKKLIESKYKNTHGNFDVSNRITRTVGPTTSNPSVNVR